MARPKRAVVGWEVERGAVQRGRLREVPSLRHTAGGDAAIACWLGWVGSIAQSAVAAAAETMSCKGEGCIVVGSPENFSNGTRSACTPSREAWVL